MNSGSTNSCFPNVSQSLQIYSMIEDHQHNHHNQHVALSSASNDQTHSSNSLLNSLSLLKEKVHQVQSFVSILLSPNHQNQPESTSIVIASMTHVIQEIIMTASSMTFNFQQMGSFGSITSGINTSTTTTNNNVIRVGNLVQERVSQALYTTTTTSDDRTLDWFSEIYNNNISNNRVDERKVNIIPLGSETKDGLRGFSSKHCDIIELNASYLLAKYTHYCQVCGKGFKRDANLRMHMRAHGDEYKTNAALTNPFKNNTSTIMGNKDSSILRSLPRKYSCPQEGCRWNKKHAKFHPLKSMICVKNHYKRSHCPKIYVCKRCNKKQFSVLSDLRTHEKHCGDLKWQCSCGTTFSRKDKLMGHVALFTGHMPIVTSSTKHGKNDDQNQVSQMQ